MRSPRMDVHPDVRAGVVLEHHTTSLRQGTSHSFLRLSGLASFHLEFSPPGFPGRRRLLRFAGVALTGALQPREQRRGQSVLSSSPATLEAKRRTFSWPAWPPGRKPRGGHRAPFAPSRRGLGGCCTLGPPGPPGRRHGPLSRPPPPAWASSGEMAAPGAFSQSLEISPLGRTLSLGSDPQPWVK